MKHIKIYMSHAIRGSKGPKATEADMQANNIAAMKVARVIREVVEDIERVFDYGIEIYCPADHDEFVLIAYRDGVLNEKEILQVDCVIVERCQALIWYSGLGPSRGAEIEKKHAQSWDIPIFELCSLDISELTKLASFMRAICQESL